MEGAVINSTSPTREMELSKLRSSPSLISPKKTPPSKTAKEAATMASQSLVEQPPWPAEVPKKYRRIAKLQDRYLSDLSKLKSERDTLAARLSNLNESLSEFAKLSEPQRGQELKYSSLKDWKAAHEQLLTDRDAVQEQMRLVTDLEQSFSRLDYKLAKALPELLALIGNFFKGDQGRARSKSAASSPKSQEPTSPALRPLEQTYYEKRGEITLLRDRIFNHHAKLNTPPDTLAGTTLTPSLPSQDAKHSGLSNQYSTFRDQWQIQHEAMARQLYEREQELKKLWNDCQDAGIDVGDVSEEIPWTPIQPSAKDADQIQTNEPPFLQLDAYGMVSDIIKGLRWPKSRPFAAPELREPADFAEKRDLIELWAGTIPSGPAAERGPSLELDHTLSNAEADPDWTHVDTHDQPVSPENHLQVSPTKEDPL